MKTTKKMSAKIASIVVGVAGFMWCMAGTLCADDQAKPADYYTEEHIYKLRPDPAGERFFGIIGATGLKAKVYPGVVLKVETMMPGSPSEGKFAKDEILTGINGTALKGLNPFVVMGNALTKAEATDGKMVFDVTSADGKTQRKETVTIPVLGAYSKTWPLDCPKSKRIIDEAAAFYADPQKFNSRDIPGALGCLFLLSTGDDKYLPRVKAYFDAFPKDVKVIGVSTWSNGYNGIACGEYYLRTGDKSVLPILQYYCDDAKKHQIYGSGWAHYGAKSVWPGYVAGGLMNPAGAQVLTTLLLGKECGVNVDEQTLLGSLRFFYRFAGHGSVPYGDHRCEGGLGSNGKDGMVAAAMLIAEGASGYVTIYEKASKQLTLGMIDSYSTMVLGHGDEGRGDGIWRGITTSYLMQEKPALFRQSMDRLTWWHDLSREPGGSIGIATLGFMHDSPIGHSGPGMGLSYTAPLRTLRITGAPKTKFSRKYTLPTKLWGTEADLAFLSLEHNPKYLEYGPEEPTHVPYFALGNAYDRPEKDIQTLPREVILKNVYHRQYMIRTQACKALRATDAFDELEKLLQDPDPRVRRAALDGLIDYNYWFCIGDNPIPTDKFTPGMVNSITKMLSDPKEAWWVVDGALLALKFAPAKDIQQNYKLIEPWTTHSDWWLREAAFRALSGLEKDDALFENILPTLLTIAASEYHTMPRSTMMNYVNGVLQKKKPESETGKLILAALRKAVDTSEIKSGDLGVSAWNVMETLKFCLQNDRTLAPALATVLQLRFSDLRTHDLVDIVAAPSGFLAVLEKLDSTQREELKDILFTVYRPEIINRFKAKDYEEGHKPATMSAIVKLTNLKEKVAVPGPATFASPPSNSGFLDIVMRATPGRGDFEPIEYFFDETS
ncbi:MAG: HEAT repeat domain-containing protein, partial [Kiritimatiellales bacterium]|nr:HEAT repeat domain-containing protein [Kiritimatiellales bacterium]